MRNVGKDPYTPLFTKTADLISKEIDHYGSVDLKNIKRLTDLRFGASFSEQAFAKHLSQTDGVFSLLSFPSKNDPMLKRTRAIRVRDQLFIDSLQDDYRQFSQTMDASYLVWQEQSLLEIEAAKKAKRKAAGQAAFGVLALGLSIAAIAAGIDASGLETATASTTAGIIAGSAGVHLLGQSFQTNKEAEIHREALQELGESIELELAPRVIEYEELTVELKGTSGEQFSQWRNFLRKIYAEEAIPEVKL